MDLSDTLVIGISATALFDLKEADELFRSESNRELAIRKYRDYMLARENEPLKDGTAMPLVEALLHLNEQYQKEGEPPLVEVVIMSKNTPETGLRVINTIRKKGLPITRYAFTGGEPVTDYLEAFDVDLFLTTDPAAAQSVIDSRRCAAAIVKEPPKEPAAPKEQVRIAFDGDAVLFDESSELIYKRDGIKEFHRHEEEHSDVPLTEGPYANFLKKLSRLQERLPMHIELTPIRIAIITARSAPAEMRVIKTLRHWNVHVDEIFFLGGLDKSRVLKAFRPHIFFDDQEHHLKKAASVVPSGKVPYPSDSEIHRVTK